MQQLVAQGLNEKQRQQMNRHKDGAMLAIGSLNTFLRNKPKYAASLEPMLLQHVFPELTSPCGHIRARAAWYAMQHQNTAKPSLLPYCLISATTCWYEY